MKTDRNALIRTAQAFRRQLNMDDETFTLLKQSLTECSSLKDMTVPQLQQLLDALRQKGAKYKNTNSKSVVKSDKHALNEVNKIKAVWITMHQQGFVKDGSVNGLNGWLKRITKQINGGKGVDRIEWLSQPKLAAKVLECLKGWHKREIKKWLQTNGSFVQDLGFDKFELCQASYLSLSTCFANEIFARVPKCN